MGDRGNILINGVYLYTHYGRHSLQGILKSALIRGKERWDDPQYLARIIFSEMIKEDIDGLTGYGLSADIMDGDVTFIVSCESQTVSCDHGEWTFNEFTA